MSAHVILDLDEQQLTQRNILLVLAGLRQRIFSQGLPPTVQGNFKFVADRIDMIYTVNVARHVVGVDGMHCQFSPQSFADHFVRITLSLRSIVRSPRCNRSAISSLVYP